MDQQMNTALRGLKAQGNVDAVIKELLDDCRLSTQHELSYSRTSLAGLGFNFGLSGADSDHLYPGDQVSASFELKEIHGTL
jgi:hypothetical protein